jgi:hypothetical protein
LIFGLDTRDAFILAVEADLPKGPLSLRGADGCQQVEFQRGQKQYGFKPCDIKNVPKPGFRQVVLDCGKKRGELGFF